MNDEANKTKKSIDFVKDEKNKEGKKDLQMHSLQVAKIQ